MAPDDLLTINNASREEPVEVHVDGRPAVELPPGEDIHVEFARSTARSPSCRARPSTTACASASGGWPAGRRQPRGGRHRNRSRFGVAAADAAHLSPSSNRMFATSPRSSRERLPIASESDRHGSVRPRLVHPRAVLEELRVENLLLIERAELRLGPGLNVLTGETGAGKTVLAHALDLLLGGKPRAGIVRPGAAEAYVEGVFALPDELRARWATGCPRTRRRSCSPGA